MTLTEAESLVFDFADLNGARTEFIRDADLLYDIVLKAATLAGMRTGFSEILQDAKGRIASAFEFYMAAIEEGRAQNPTDLDDREFLQRVFTISCQISNYHWIDSADREAVARANREIAASRGPETWSVETMDLVAKYFSA